MRRAKDHKFTVKGLLALIVLAASAPGAIAPPSAAQSSLKELRGREAEERALDREAAYTQSVCAISLTALIDWRSASDWPADISIAAACDGALGALEVMCRTETGKRKAQRFNHFVCAGDGTGASIRGDILRYGASPTGNGFAETMEMLERSF